MNWEQPSTQPVNYNIYRRNNPNNPYEFLENTIEIFYHDTGLSYGIYYYVVTAVYEEGESSFSNPTQAYSGSVGNEDNNVPSNCVMKLHNNYPNPFNPSTTISFDLPRETDVEITVYNIKGQKVKVLTNDHFEKGTHSVIWNGKDNSNKSVASGIYFYKLSAGNETKVNKMLLLK